MIVIKLGIVLFLHCGTPCNTFTSARKLDGGPPPLRSQALPLGLPELSSDNAALVMLGNIFLFRTAEACLCVFQFGGNSSIELDFDQCAFGAPSVKPTRLLCSTDLLDDVCMKCPGGHKHVQLKGKVWDPVQQKMVFRTKQASSVPVGSVRHSGVSCHRHDPGPTRAFFSLVSADDPGRRSQASLGLRSIVARTPSS
jgi:hypothetical protein